MQAEAVPAQGAQAALPQPGEAPLKRAFQAETAQEPQAGSQPPQDMQAEAVPAQELQAGSQPPQDMQAEAVPAQGAQAALPQPGEAPLKRAFQAETAQGAQAGSQLPQDMQAEAVPAQGGATPGDGAEREALGRTIPPEERSHYVYVENDDWDEDGFFTDWDVEQPIADEEDAAEADDGTETGRRSGAAAGRRFR